MCKHAKETNVDRLERLFIAACCLPGEARDSERRTEAASALTGFAEELLPAQQFATLADWCLKATLDETTNQTYEVCRKHLKGQPS